MTDSPGAFEQIRAVLRSIPRGEVLSYGEVARQAGFPRGARTVVWVLKTSERYALPWHRVVRKDRRLAIQDPEGRTLQAKLLEAEGWTLNADGTLTKPPVRDSGATPALTPEGNRALVPISLSS